MAPISRHRSISRKHKLRKWCIIVAVFFCFVGLETLLSTKILDLQSDIPSYSNIEALSPRSDESIAADVFGCGSFPDNVSKSRFFPKRFFEQGSGKEFMGLLEGNFADILNARFLVFNMTAHCKIVHYHIHKNGGTTLERHVPLATDNYYSKREKSLGRIEFEILSKNIMQNVYHMQNNHQSRLELHRDVRVFTFLRDPVSRFLSGVAQVLKLRTWHKRLFPCYELNMTVELLDCVLEKLDHGSFLDQHLAPQSFELYKEVMGFDIAVDVIDLSEITLILRQLGAREWAKERSTTGSLIRRFPQFRLTPNVLTPKQIKKICRIYQSDVVMLKEVGVTNTVCI